MDWQISVCLSVTLYFSFGESVRAPLPVWAKQTKGLHSSPLPKSRRRDSSQTKPDIEKMKDTKKSCLGLYMCAFEKNLTSDHSNHTFLTFYVQKTCFSRITFFGEELDRISFRISILHFNARFLIPILSKSSVRFSRYGAPKLGVSICTLRNLNC